MFIGAGFGLFFLVFVVLGLGSVVLAVMCAVDSSKYPDWAFQQTGSSKFVWQILPVILLLVCGIAGGVLGLIWYTSKRQEVERAALAGGPPPYYGAPPPVFPPPAPWGQPQPPPGMPPVPPPSYPPPPPPPAEPPQ
jgi:hypothetical protein